jgi:2-polyprenyl-3-methyl-5-hydroxy-6-metoxy-1,4-benzoquinol methylase
VAASVVLDHASLLHSSAQTVSKSTYIIRGGVQGRERLRILSRVMRPTSLNLLRRAGLRSSISCLEIGCGGGDLAFDMARAVGTEGRIVGTDIDEKKLEIAAQEAKKLGLANIEFRFEDIAEYEPREQFDLVHARFVLTHLVEPAAALARMRRALRPRAAIAIEDIDFRGHFSQPENTALYRYVELYTETVRRRCTDANIGPRLPGLVAAAGFARVQMNVVQPAGAEGEVKLLPALTMENIADAVLAEGLASRAEIDQLVSELYDLARTPGAVVSGPRVVEVWAERPTS